MTAPMLPQVASYEPKWRTQAGKPDEAVRRWRRGSWPRTGG